MKTALLGMASGGVTPTAGSAVRLMRSWARARRAADRGERSKRGVDGEGEGVRLRRDVRKEEMLVLGRGAIMRITISANESIYLMSAQSSL